MGLIGLDGRPLSDARRGEQVDGYSLPDGAVVCKAASLALHQRIKDNVGGLRERLEAAQRMTGRKILHLSLLDHNNKNVNSGVDSAIEKNLDFGEKIQRSRVKSEKLKHSGRAYANLKTA
jgi:hypothetical protein